MANTGLEHYCIRGITSIPLGDTYTGWLSLLKTPPLYCNTITSNMFTGTLNKLMTSHWKQTKMKMCCITEDKKTHTAGITTSNTSILTEAWGCCSQAGIATWMKQINPPLAQQSANKGRLGVESGSPFSIKKAIKHNLIFMKWACWTTIENGFVNIMKLLWGRRLSDLPLLAMHADLPVLGLQAPGHLICMLANLFKYSQIWLKKKTLKSLSKSCINVSS